MKKLIWPLLLISVSSYAQGLREYPMGPIAQFTPGELCSTPSRYRYPEQIAYCERDVAVELKDQVFATYRRQGYRMPYTDRSSYKIDHYIPLCAGGANTAKNLWPQHLSISTVTDSIEKLGCDKMAAGRLTQAKFVVLIKKVKNDLKQAQAVTLELSRL